MRFLYDNEYDKYSLSFSSEHSSYPIENLQDYQLAKKWRSTGDTDEWVKIDAGEGNTITATGAAILGHNLTDDESTFKIQGDNADDNWGDPSVNEEITHNADLMTEYFTSAARRYWRFHFADGNNPDEYVSAGRLVLCVYLETDTAGRDFSILYDDTSSVDESLTGQSFGDERIIRKIINLKFPFWIDTVRKSIVTMIKNIKKVKPIVLVLDENDQTSVVPVYARLNDNMSINHIIGYNWNGILSFKQEV